MCADTLTVDTLITTFTSGTLFGAVLMFLGAWIAITVAFRRSH